MLLQRHPVQITFPGFFIPLTSSTICYYPDGSNAAEIPCPDPVSLSCCPAESNCLTNGLCWDSRNFMFRGSCRDKSWTNPNCPQFCYECESRPYKLDLFRIGIDWDSSCLSDIPSSGKVLAPCNDSGLFTCNYSCSASNLTVPRGSIVLRDYQISFSPLTSASTASTFSSTSASASTSSTFSSRSTFTTASSTPTSPPLNLVPDGNCTNNLAYPCATNRSPNLAAVTAGVSVPLGIAWLVTLVFFYRLRRKMRILEQGKSQWRLDYQHAKWSGNPHGFGVGSTELPENQERSELAGVSSPHEMQG